MTKNTKLMLAAAAMSGLLVGTSTRASAAPVSSGSTGQSIVSGKGKVLTGVAGRTLADDSTKNKDKGKHDCKGKNDCKGQGGCKSGDNGCKGKNSCKGKGGCNTKKSDHK